MCPLACQPHTGPPPRPASQSPDPTHTHTGCPAPSGRLPARGCRGRGEQPRKPPSPGSLGPCRVPGSRVEEPTPAAPPAPGFRFCSRQMKGQETGREGQREPQSGGLRPGRKSVLRCRGWCEGGAAARQQVPNLSGRLVAWCEGGAGAGAVQSAGPLVSHCARDWWAPGQGPASAHVLGACHAEAFLL